MKISIFGLGYVGAVTAGCLVRRGHSIVGVDIHPQKVAAFNEGRAPIVEPGLDALLAEGHRLGLLRATANVEEALLTTDVSIVCVGTPSSASGALDLSFVHEVTREFAQLLRPMPKRHIVIYRSTMLPGSTREVVREHLNDLMRKESVIVLYFPEFLREGTAVKDFENSSMAVIGTKDGSPPPAELNELFLTGGTAPRVVDWNTAEMVKYACNAFHAAKVTFANEIGRLSKELKVDGQRVMELLCEDTRLNISPYYLKPGNPFGGSCLPKDVRALAHCARSSGVSLPLIEHLLLSNDQHLQRLVAQITLAGQREVVILGLTFKQETDDLRESAMVEVAQQLIGRGFTLRIFDPQINLARLVGRNKSVIETRMPHLASLLCHDLKTALGSGGIVVAAQKCVSIEELKAGLTPNHSVLDVNGWPALKTLGTAYHGFCW